MVLATLVTVSSGCQLFSKTDPSAAQAQALEREFHEQLVATTEAIKAAELDLARSHLVEARLAAFRPAHKEKVESLDRLIDGAQALLDGDPSTARVEWSRITDAQLNDEVRQKAAQFGMTVPGTPVESGTE